MRKAGPVAALALLVCLSSLGRWAGARLVPSPWFTPDEQIYALLGRSLYHTGHFEILDHSTRLYSFLYPALIGLPLSAHDLSRGYATSKALQALVMSLTAVPVYLWGRTLMRPAWAWVAALLTVCVPALALSGFLMTEVLFYPVVVLASWALATALARPTIVAQALALGGIVLAAATRLQALVLVPALLLAICLKLVFERTRPRAALRFAPLLGGLAVVAGVWLAVSGGRFLGDYEVVGTVDYELGAVLRYAAYHAADLALATVVLPVVATALLSVRAFAGREESPDVRAFLAVAIGVSAALVLQVGGFASEFVLRLAERDLIGAMPLLFLGFALWLDRGSPRPARVLIPVSAVIVVLFAAVPWPRFVTEAAEPDALTLVPLYQLVAAAPRTDLRLLVTVTAAALLVGFALVPAGARVALPILVAATLLGASVSASHTVAKQARGYREITVGPQKRWIDEALPRGASVAYLYSGELAWSGGATVWQNLFWNRRLHRVYDLGAATVVGPLPQVRLSPTRHGVFTAAGRTVAPSYVVASTNIGLAGSPIAASAPARLLLWRAASPLRALSITNGYDTWTGALAPTATVTVYGCAGGWLELTASSDVRTRVQVFVAGSSRSTVVEPQQPTPIRVPARPTREVCRFVLKSNGDVRATTFGFERRRASSARSG